MGEVRLVRVVDFEMMQMTEREMHLTQFGRQFSFTNLLTGQMQSVTLHQLMAIDKNSALQGARATSSPRIIDRAKISDRRAPFESSCGPLGGGANQRQHRERMQDRHIAQSTGPLQDRRRFTLAQ